MNDPHLESLVYNVIFPETVKFDDTPSLVYENSQSKLILEKGLLTIEPKEHFSSIENARREIEPFLRSWEIDIALNYGKNEMTFSFLEGHIIDRAPSVNTHQIIDAQASLIEISSLNVTATVHRGTYSEPPNMFEVTPDVETLWNRYQGYLNGHEPLPSMGYFCFTVLEYIGGNKKSFAREYKVSEPVLNNLSEFTTLKGDAITARKWKGRASRIPLTAQEIKWVQEAIKIIIRRIGEYAHIANLPQITMSDLPPLNP